MLPFEINVLCVNPASQHIPMASQMLIPDGNGTQGRKEPCRWKGCCIEGKRQVQAEFILIRTELIDLKLARERTGNAQTLYITVCILQTPAE